MKSRSAMMYSLLFIYITLLLHAYAEEFSYKRHGKLPLRIIRNKQLPVPSEHLLPRPASAAVLAINLRGGGIPSIVNFNALAETVKAMGPAAPLGFAGIFCALELIGIPVAPMGPLAGETSLYSLILYIIRCDLWDDRFCSVELFLA